MTIRVFGNRHYTGDGDDDLLELDPRHLAKARIDLGTGFDTLAVTAAGDFAFSEQSFVSMTGVDVLDFSRSGAGVLSITISEAIVNQSDNQLLTVLSGSNGIDSLAAAGIAAGTVIVGGTGVVHLADGLQNVVTLANGSSVSVVGGSGDDTIRSAGSGSILQGGGGADTLIAAGGADDVLFSAGDGADTIIGFNTGLDWLDLNGFALEDFNAFMSQVTETSDGARVDFGQGGSLTFQGLSMAELAKATIVADGTVLDHGPSVVNIAVGTTAGEINTLIEGADAGTTFVFADGIHTLTAPIVINRSDVSVLGESEAGTVLRFSLAAGSEADAIQLTGGAKTYVGTAQTSISVGDDRVVLAARHGLGAGDTIYLYQPNTQDYLTENGWTNVSWTDADQRPFREFIAEIDHMEGDTAVLKSPVPYAMGMAETRVFKMAMLTGVTLGDFTVTYDFGTANPYDFVNTLPAFDGLSAVQLTAVSGASLNDIAVVDAASNGISITSSIGIEGTSLSVIGAHNKGGGGNGYGLLLTEAFDNSFTGLDLRDGRHSLVFSAWSAETGNTVDIVTTNRDINFHGSPDVGNAVTVDRGVLDYDPASDTSGTNSIWAIFSGGGTAHAATDIYGSNSVAFSTAVASTANDDIRGTTGDDYLNAGFGYDSLDGGDGNDYLVGGTRKDLMTGGNGSDTFLLRMGDDLDTITDFTFGPDGDILIFSGDAAVTSAADLTFAENGSDLYVRYGSNSTVILRDHVLADVDAANFQFDPTGALTAAAYSGEDANITTPASSLSPLATPDISTMLIPPSIPAQA